MKFLLVKEEMANLVVKDQVKMVNLLGLKSMVRIPNPESRVMVEKVVVKKMVEKVEMVVVVDLVLLEQEEEVMKVATVVEQEGLTGGTQREVKQTQDQNHVTKVDQEKDQKSVVDL